MSATPTIALPASDALTFLRSRLGNVWGQQRRFLIGLFGSDYIQRQAARRRGECNRCGLCCQLVFKCPSLRYENGLASCGRYHSRPSNCRIFPISEADLEDVRRLAPEAGCSFHFAPPPS